MGERVTVWAVAYKDRVDARTGEKPTTMYLPSREYLRKCNPSAVGCVAYANRFYHREGAEEWRDEMQENHEEKLFLVKVTSANKRA